VDNRYAIVVTTINYPTQALGEIANSAPKLDAKFFIVGDAKSPSDFHQQGALYFDIGTQNNMGFRYAAIAPDRHYARKNVGYLAAYRDGANVIIETDDDNIPRAGFWSPRISTINSATLTGPNWVNVYSYFSKCLIWPRGLPLTAVRQTQRLISDLPKKTVYCPIQQGLADDNPDVDAIYRLLLELPIRFDPCDPILLTGAWCPFNSQNTTWFEDAFPLLYLPYFCSFRMTDIWRSFVAQRIAFANGWGIMYHNSTVYQDRNYHDLMQDFEEEIPGYLHNDKIRLSLQELNLPAGTDNICAAMRVCYRLLCDIGIIDRREIELLDAWFDDLYSIQKSRSVG
jgi:STELLO glycosyltransferases